jgi:hypothetical protein
LWRFIVVWLTKFYGADKTRLIAKSLIEILDAATFASFMLRAEDEARNFCWSTKLAFDGSL